MRILFIDTSREDVSIVIINDNKIEFKLNENTLGKHSANTLVFIEKAFKETNLNKTDIDKILIATGPGSFTGIRVGLTISKMYGYIEDIPLIPVSSLKMIALSTKGDKILSIIGAKNDNYYIGVYDKEYNDIIEEHFTSKEEILEIINNNIGITLVSDKAEVIEDFLFKKVEFDFEAIASYYKNKESINPHAINSNYLKLTSAEENLQK